MPKVRPTATNTADGQTGKYQATDKEIVDYQYFTLPETSALARGPAPTTLNQGGYIACIGGAQTLGRFVERPYSHQIADTLQHQVLNLGHGGGKPQYYNSRPALFRYLNKASAVIVQVVSARAVENSIFKPASIENSFLIDKRKQDGEKPQFANHAYGRLLREAGPEVVARIVAETREQWTSEMTTLLMRIKVPKILLWLSVRPPDYQESFETVDSVLGAYPHLVNRAMIDALRPVADAYVEYTGSVGLPQKLVSRFDGNPVAVFPRQEVPSENLYYPSPEMHKEVAEMILSLTDLAKWVKGKE